jgi:glutamyl-tRNA synthetase
LLAWLSARSQHGRVLLRIEDLDSPRVKPWAVQQALEDLAWLGLDWDEGPDRPASVARSAHGPPSAPGVPQRYIQSQRLALYAEALAELQRRELVYPCTCTRRDVEAAASAPHAGQEGPVYPGTCAHRRVQDAAGLAGQPFAWRFRVQTAAGRQSPVKTAESALRVAYTDRFAGPQDCHVARDLGDFVVARSDGKPAYQLAVVVDDHEMGITEVVRGDDLIPSTFRQLLLYAVFDWQPPQFAHVPLVIGPDGRRLAKRHGDTRISLLREAGIPAERLIGFLAWSCGLQTTTRPIAARELIPTFAWAKVPPAPFVFTPAMWRKLSDRSEP